jgi:hypothetical protein
MMPRVVNVAPLPKYRLHVEFDDGVSRTIDHGVSRTIDHSGEFDGEVLQPLRDEALFRQVTVHEFGAVCWPNGPRPRARRHAQRAYQRADVPTRPCRVYPLFLRPDRKRGERRAEKPRAWASVQTEMKKLATSTLAVPAKNRDPCVCCFELLNRLQWLTTGYRLVQWERWTPAFRRGSRVVRLPNDSCSAAQRIPPPTVAGWRFLRPDTAAVFPKGLLEGTEPSQWKLPRRKREKRRNALRFSALHLPERHDA